MTKLIALFFCFLSCALYGQNISPIGSPTTINQAKGGYGNDSMFINAHANDSATAFYNKRGAQRFFDGTNSLWYRDSLYWQRIISLTAMIDTLKSYVRIQTQNPTASISASPTVYPLTSASTQSVNLGWSAGRLGATATQFATANISTIVVGGVGQSFIQPSAPGTVSGTQTVTIPTNTTTVLSNVTTTVDGKVATASIPISFSPNRYFGWISDTTNIGVFGTYNDAVLLALPNDLSSSNVFSFNPGAATNKFLAIIYISTTAALQSINIAGIGSLGAFNKVTRNLVNATGSTMSVRIYYNTQAQTTDGIGYNIVTQ